MNQLQISAKMIAEMRAEFERFVASLEEKAVEEQRIEDSQIKDGAALLKLVSYLSREQRIAKQQKAERNVPYHMDDGEDEYWHFRSQIFDEINNQLDVFITQPS